jgi:hypothetical protein
MVPGTNFVFTMDEGIRLSSHTIAVLSPAYLRSAWARLESFGALHRDPLGRQRTLLPVRIEACDPSGLLGMITRIDIFGLTEAEARSGLLDGVATAERGRAKPDSPAEFPADVRQPRYPGIKAPPGQTAEPRTCLAIDVDDYRRNDSALREHTRTRLLDMLAEVLAIAAVPRHNCTVVDRIDGVAVILPAESTGPAVTAALISGLCEGISSLGRPAAQEAVVRLRAAIAVGAVDLDSVTFEGPGTSRAQALVSAPQVRAATALAARTRSAIIVADDLYPPAVSAGASGGFTRIPVSVDESAWIRLCAVSAGATSRGPGRGGGATGQPGSAAAAAVFLVTGPLAAQEWAHLIDHLAGSAGDPLPHLPHDGAADDAADESLAADSYTADPYTLHPDPAGLGPGTCFEQHDQSFPHPAVSFDSDWAYTEAYDEESGERLGDDAVADNTIDEQNSGPWGI